MDRLLEEACSGPFYLCRPAVADMIVTAIHYNAGTLRQYELHAYAVMPNHVHLLITPAVALSKLTKSLKGITAKRANVMLGLVRDAGEYRWSSAGWATRGSPADQGVRPTIGSLACT